MFAVIWFALLVFSCATGNTAESRSIQKPKFDPPDQFFRRAPMAQASRSIVVPLSTNLHWAFDAENLRTHTVWAGSGLRLYGPPYHGAKSPFLCDFDGRVLWTLPAMSSWFSEADELLGAPVGRPGSDFKAIETKSGRVELKYAIGLGPDRTMAVREAAYALSAEWGVGRRISVGPVERPIFFLAHAEMGTVTGSPDHAAYVQRPGDVLVSVLRGATGLEWRVVEGDVEYDEPVHTERSGESEIVMKKVRGRQARLFVAVPAHGAEVEFQVETVVCADLASAKRWVEEADRLAGAKLDVSRMGKRSLRAEEVPVHGKPRPPGGDEFYRIEHLPVPKDLMVTGMDWLPNGDLVVCTWPGDLYVVENVYGASGSIRYRKFASGLNEPLGVKVMGDAIFMVQKSELTRVRDTDQDGQADLFESICNDWGYSGNYHAFAFGPVIDRQGRMFAFLCGQRGRWEIPYVGWAVEIFNEGRMEGFCYGLRAPNGVGLFKDDLFVADNQGNWVATSKLSHLQRSRFYGFPSGFPAPREEYKDPIDPAAPAVWLPRKLSPSVSGFITIEDDRFGPFRGQMLVGDFQNAIVMRVFLERVSGQWQGAVWPFARGFLSGVNRLVMGKDGCVYVGGLKNSAWPAAAPFEASLDRIRFTGKSPFEIQEARVTSDGFDLQFTEQVDAVSAVNVENYFVTQHTYRYHAAYGSPEFDHEGRENSATEIKVLKATLSNDGRTVRLVLQGLRTNFVTTITAVDVQSASGQSLRHETLYYTLNQR